MNPLLLLLLLNQAPDTTQVFQAKTEGYDLFRIPVVVVTARGSVLVACEARKSARGDWGHIDLLLRRSTDAGKSFSKPLLLPKPRGPFERNPAALKQNLGKEGELTLNNPVLIADRDGTVHFLFCVEYMRVFYSKSNDDGLSFSEPVEITSALEPLRKNYPWIVCATGPGHGIQTSKGRLLVPVWLSRGTGGHAHRPSSITTLVSDDQGKTWKAGDIIANETDPLINPNETTAAELPDGSVLLNIRHESKSNRRAQAVSPDGSTRWTTPVFVEALTEPICFGALVRSGPNLVFSHPDNLLKGGKAGQPGTSRDRVNLSIHVSKDSGKTWNPLRVIEAGPSAYSDLAVLPDGTVLCFYEHGKKSAYEFLSLKRFPVK